MLLFAVVLAIWLLASVVRRPTSPGRLRAQAFGATLAVVAVVRLAWIVDWLLEQR